MKTIRISTTQNVFIHHPVSSIGDRILAYLIDRLILVAYTVVFVALFLNLNMDIFWVWLIVIGTPWLLYHLLFEIFMNGQTPGKHALRIKVVRLDGAPATIGAYLLRWIFSFIDYYILGGAIALVVIAIGGRGQRLGDIVAGTAVVKLVEQKEIDSREVFVTADKEYIPTFTQVIQLNEKDIELIQRALEVNRDLGNPRPLMAISEKVKSLLGVQTDLPPIKFLYTVIKDFNHLTAR